jgi:hypothetical protein
MRVNIMRDDIIYMIQYFDTIYQSTTMIKEFYIFKRHLKKNKRSTK